ncbi:transcriptional regulator, CdaR [Gluconacetobacter diazotrophicus PA1 5]|uniref:Carbohydrate diacid regulon transcriptional regulator CdaR n=2 Tax=Gluconacetobacter diazotrophicus TaxID=33996 RepID=A0A7W4FCA6_GLUDI|nr:sugar diacid recognition domain-containing protein [Gluconacetobacter diazotrophicus]ACI51163.1 transcriptional regulator, CdaR [Gluconacetobacter diazotrophicus PA1 5]MBB2155123.1 carbohydrate diacid regulon transcriptional regulator CdaR [Gluconacetobacter diazotrophicus]TWB07560.1 CdaR family transcriptional regulator [Gluconacetobacter diazotrophicus]
MPSVAIDPALAQAIVDRSMTVIACNINVMDSHGVIIASGDPARLGQVHDGALRVMARQEAVEIEPRAAPPDGDARPGVNLPLRLGGAVVGCVGLTGVPGTIRPYAELVRMAAETMLEQAQQSRTLSRETRLREELVLSLIRDEAPIPALAASAARLGIDLRPARVAAIVEILPRTQDGIALVGDMHRLGTLLGAPDQGNLVAPLSLTEIAVLTPALTARGTWDPDRLRERAQRLLARAQTATGLDLRLALGRPVEGPGGMARSYQVARATLAAGRRLHPARRALFYEDMRLPVLLDDPLRDWRTQELRAPLRPLTDAARHAPLLRTLRTWLDHGMQQRATAAALGLHRNSLDYRLRQIERLCGVDLTRSADIVALYLALHLTPDAVPDRPADPDPAPVVT